MKLRVVAVGKLKLRAERELCDEYYARLRRFGSLDEHELEDGPKLLLGMRKKLEGANVVALDVKGRTLTSEELARRLEALASRGKGVVAFCIGGADGLPAAINADAAERWSLSALTLPHRLARIVVAEQLYRAMTILRGEPYHH
ncbi:MAG: 23S rRNA (pseudouridine(1915)-N(3))-methyltransferase RlmH [Myxococcales bacterium]|nr:23S rRNA (pseudouridine(1915)-N(3))-methyltransferase RlmH [Myxococcales bacterium]